jgi:hypothetical protein
MLAVGESLGSLGRRLPWPNWNPKSGILGFDALWWKSPWRRPLTSNAMEIVGMNATNSTCVQSSTRQT